MTQWRLHYDIRPSENQHYPVLIYKIFEEKLILRKLINAIILKKTIENKKTRNVLATSPKEISALQHKRKMLSYN